MELCFPQESSWQVNIWDNLIGTVSLFIAHVLYHAIVQSFKKALLNLSTEVSFKCSNSASFKDLHNLY
jgi:hypothetical protein